jgi:hypothetical protein
MPLLPPEFRLDEEPLQPSAAPPERVAGGTPVSGIPVVPSVDDGRTSAFPAAAPPGPAEPRFSTPEPPRPSEPEPPVRSGRSRLVLVGAAAAGVLGIGYAAGLLLDHADVPNGTTVLGVDIGGTTEEEAVNKLDAALGDAATAPLTVDIGGTEKELGTNVAGLSLNTEATVSNASGRDYNPVSVIGSLIGGSRDAEPAFTVDEEKLRAALEGLSPGSDTGGAARDGMVRFENGEAVAVPGKAYTALDVRKSVTKVEQAYRDRAATGRNGAVTLPVSKQEPKVTEQELQRAIKEFGEPAMSGWVWLRAGAVEVPFSAETISEFLTMKPSANGELQPVIDTKVLAEKYGGAFDDVVIDAAAGKVAMTPKHAAAAMTEALREPAPAEPEKRLAVVEGAQSQ